MSKSRIKIPLPTITTRDEAEAVMNDLANVANLRRKYITKLDAQILEAQDKAAPGIASCDDDIKSKSDALRVWAETNPELFTKRKSLDLMSGVLGFRTGTPKLALLNRSWTWDKVLEAILARGFAFVRTKEEIDKEAILAFHAADANKPEVESKVLRPIGVTIKQDEGFFIEPKLTDTESATV